MAEYLVYPKHSPQNVLLTLISSSLTTAVFTGSIINSIFCNENTEVTELYVVTNRDVGTLIKRLTDGSLVESLIRLKYVGNAHARYKLGLRVADKFFTVHIHDPEPDFTFKNIALKYSNNTEGLSCKMTHPDPTGQMDSLKFYAKCIEDIRLKRLVPMCSEEALVLTEQSSSNGRRSFLFLLCTALELQAQGWTLCPSLSGKSLEYTLYTAPSAENDEEPEVCSICMENLLPPSINPDEKGKKTADRVEGTEGSMLRPIDILHSKNVAKHKKPTAIGAKRRSHNFAPSKGAIDSDELSYTSLMTPLKLVCGHSYHLKCLCHLMLEEGPTSYKCPLCQKEILFSGTYAPVDPSLPEERPRRRPLIAREPARSVLIRGEPLRTTYYTGDPEEDDEIQEAQEEEVVESDDNVEE